MSPAARDERIASGYWQYVLEHHLEPSAVLEQCYWAAWKAGGKQVLHDTSELAGIGAALHEMTAAARELIAWLENG